MKIFLKVIKKMDRMVTVPRIVKVKIEIFDLFKSDKII